MADLKKGFSIKTKDFKTVVVEEKLGEGGQGAVYKVDYNGQKKALKWYTGKKITNPKSICDDDILEREQGVRIAFSFHAENPPPIAFYLCSDGIDDNYPVEGNETHLYKLYRTISLAFADDGYESTCKQLKDLANQFATKGKGDDTSLAGIINIDKIKKVAPLWKKNIEEAESKRAIKKAEEEKVAEEARISEEMAAAETNETNLDYGSFERPANNKNAEETKATKIDIVSAVIDARSKDFEAKNASDAYQKQIPKKT